jgi:hypothetical protein
MGDGVAKMETPAFMPGRTSIDNASVDGSNTRWPGDRRRLESVNTPSNSDNQSHLILKVTDELGQGRPHGLALQAEFATS